VACLYCGKEIGPLRILRDKEFCSPKHRKEYKDRLQRVLVQVGEPQTVPKGIAPFQDSLRPIIGPNRCASAAFDFSSARHQAKLPATWTMAIPDSGPTTFASLTLTARDLTVGTPAFVSHAEALPYFGNTAAAGLLTLPEPKLGALLLRSTEGRLLSEPIALEYPAARTRPPAIQSPAPHARTKQSGNPALPAIGLPGADCEEIKRAAELPLSETWMNTPEADPVLSDSEPAVSLPAPPVTSLHVPDDLPEAAIEAQPAVGDAVAPPVCGIWMPSLAPVPVERMIRPLGAPFISALSPLRLPAALTANPAVPRPALHAAYLASPEPQAANLNSKPAAPVAASILARQVALPNLPAFDVSRPVLSANETRCQPLPASSPMAHELTARTDCCPVSFAAPPLRFAPLVLDAVHEPAPQPVVEAPAAPTAEPETRNAPRRPAPGKPPSLLPLDSPTPAKRLTAEPPPLAPIEMPAPAATRQPPTEVPQPGLFALDYRSAPGPMVARPNLFWHRHTAFLNMPRFAVRPLFDRLEDQSPPKRESKKPAFAEILTMPEAIELSRRKAARHAFTAIAASITVAMALWFGANAGKLGNDLIKREAEIAAASRRQAGGLQTASATRPAPDAFKHPVAWIQTEAAKRATVQLADSFDNGMTAWGSKAKGLAPGWSRSADGYVRPGQLALFQPTLNFTDYRMEFFGQIENQSMSWVVRGKDTQNYYAMKFNVVEPGLRPVISMTHYPVIGGKQGHKVVTPLSVMVHSETPYHVAVDVRGSHYTASIEGQEVDSWSDDTLLAGGVGFFADAGSRARIYWMKVSKNDDWLGRLCNYIAGDTGAQTTAWLDRPALPAPAPENPSPAPAAAALWPAEIGEGLFAGWQKEKGSAKGEIAKWSS
jgi:hypothetical protein